MVSGAVSVPVAASGGAGEAAHVVEVLNKGAAAALVAGILHDGLATVAELKRKMVESGIPTRTT
jgi:imidazole glycerol-phosphate synthase subunit HisF